MVEFYRDSLSSAILKAPHHGRDSGYCDDFVKYVNPDYTIVSVGKKPDSDASTKYKKHTQRRVLSTRMQGTMHLKMYEDGSYELTNHANERLDLDEDITSNSASYSPYRGR